MTVTGDAGPQPVTGEAVAAMRAFNRLYTNVIGVLRGGYLGSPYSLTEARLIFELGQREVTEVAQLRRSLDIDAGYLSRILARFEADQLITRERSGADARRQVIALTEAGRTIQAGLDAQAARQIGTLLAGLSGPARRRLLAGIREVTGVLAGTDQPRSYVLRPPRPGELGWVVQAQTAATRSSTGGMARMRQWWRGSSPITASTATRSGKRPGSPRWTPSRLGRCSAFAKATRWPSSGCYTWTRRLAGSGSAPGWWRSASGSRGGRLPRDHVVDQQRAGRGPADLPPGRLQAGGRGAAPELRPGPHRPELVPAALTARARP